MVMTRGCVIHAMRCIRPWQFGQASTSTANTLSSSISLFTTIERDSALKRMSQLAYLRLGT